MKLCNFLICLILYAFPITSTYSYCPYHEDERNAINRLAVQSLYEANQMGGDFFRYSYVFTYEEAAREKFKYKSSYSRFVPVYRHFLSLCNTEESIPAFKRLCEGFYEVGDQFLDLYDACIARHKNVNSTYERGKIYFDRGQYTKCLNDIEKLTIKDMPKNSIDELFALQGQLALETGLYENAILALTEAINKNPKKKEVYFSRACAYFETGNLDLALNDYLHSDTSKLLPKVKSHTTSAFSHALLNGLKRGGVEAAIDFVPSLLETTYGLGCCLWIFTQHPVNSTTHFINSCQNLAECGLEYFKSLDQEKLEEYAIELKNLYERFEQLDNSAKGDQIGYIIGKYGVDLFATAGAAKAISALKQLKDANRICTLEAMAISQSNKEIIAAKAFEHASQREKYFKNVKIAHDKQNKHILGKHNFDKDKSVFEHKDPQGLLDKFAGTGRPMNKELPGSPSYKENIDFGEHIGIWKSGNNNIALPTTKGTIHYAKDGAHIVPAHPESLVVK